MDKTELRAKAFYIQAAKIDRAWEDYKKDIEPFELKRSDTIKAAEEEYLQVLKEIDEDTSV